MYVSVNHGYVATLCFVYVVTFSYLGLFFPKRVSDSRFLLGVRTRFPRLKSLSTGTLYDSSVLLL